MLFDKIAGFARRAPDEGDSPWLAAPHQAPRNMPYLVDIRVVAEDRSAAEGALESAVTR
jgi:hypothetical protein